MRGQAIGRNHIEANPGYLAGNIQVVRACSQTRLSHAPMGMDKGPGTMQNCMRATQGTVQCFRFIEIKDAVFQAQPAGKFHQLSRISTGQNRAQAPLYRHAGGQFSGVPIGSVNQEVRLHNTNTRLPPS